MIKILAVFGTRPEAIKMMPLVKKLKGDSNFECKICVTGQHREMLDQVLNLFDIIPDYDLNIMKSGQTLVDISSTIILDLAFVLDQYRPEYLLVHGDTSTTAAAALTAYYYKVKVCHIEAGLRTGDLYSPWPEEGNRKIVAALSDMHFAPTQVSADNLIRENINPLKIVVTGNTVIDALYMTLGILDNHKTLKNNILNEFKFIAGSRKKILITCHRRENFGGGIERICEAIQILANKFPDVDFIYPVHLNPNIRMPVSRYLSNIHNVHLTDPLDYLPFVYIMSLSYIILTDSGGIQEEAPSLGCPVLVMREMTERPEAVMAGTVKLVGTSVEKIVNSVSEILLDFSVYEEMSEAQNPYGDGHASEKICAAILSNFLNASPRL